MASQRKAGALLGYANILTKNIVNFMYTPLLLHFLGQDDYGVFQMTNSVVFALTLLSAGFSGSYVRFYMIHRTQNEEEKIDKLNGMFMMIYAAASLISIIAGVFLVAFVRQLFSKGLNPDEVNLTRSLMVIMVINIAVTFLSTPYTSFITAKERFVFQQTRQLATTLAQPALAVVLLLMGFGAIGVSLAILFVNVALLVLNAHYARNRLHMRFRFNDLDKNLFKAIAVFSFWILLNQIFDLVNNQVPNFLLGAMAGASVVATYSIATQIRNLFFSLSTTISGVFIPKINRIVATSDDNHKLTTLMTQLGRYQMLLFWYVYGGFILVGQYFVQIWAGRQNMAAYWLAAAMTLPVMIPLTQNVGIEIQRAKNRHRARSVIYILTAALDIAISVALIPRMGYWATAIGYIASILLGTGLFMNWYYHTRIGLNMMYFWRHQLPIIAGGVGVLAVCLIGAHFIPIHSVSVFIAWIVVYSAVFGGVFWACILNKQEKGLVLNRFAKKH
ncbi:lipopolysaccharide biosynthesis protein [Bifidobacterium pseudolongum]|uniref:lipopolysaccharide biosynthesis protein n=1 Tax=Bifidobacterium pseudolongum TaxID=1694 RepID=UPI001020FB35|nr:oligosaccharide flippase family protein [Bifidobacterium pseudolongum]RYQ70488.1 Polysaccharide biosynthesis protein [Bifidobacterium pseudolongum subsp. globosum]